MRKKIDRTYRKGTEVGKNSRILQSTDNWVTGRFQEAIRDVGKFYHLYLVNSGERYDGNTIVTCHYRQRRRQSRAFSSFCKSLGFIWTQKTAPKIVKIRTKSHLFSLTEISSSLATTAQTKSGTEVPGASLKSSWISSLGRYCKSTRVRPIWNAHCKRSWRGRRVKMVCKEVTPRLPVEKLKKSEYPSWVRPPLVGLENCCSRTGRCASSLRSLLD